MFEGGLIGFLDDIKNGFDCVVADAKCRAVHNKNIKDYGDEENDDDDESDDE